MELTFLGTGICLSPIKVNTGILLEDKDNLMLIDCCGGAELLRQLYKIGLSPQFSKNPKPIDHVFLSHRHPDHSFGLLYLLSDQGPTRKKNPTKIYCSKCTKENMLKLIESTGFSYMLKRIKIRWIVLEPGSKLNIFDNAEVVAFRAEHKNYPGDDGLGFVFNINNKKIVFSGDTKPCSGLVEHGMNCDLLIHECFSVRNKDPAKNHGHSDAVDVGEIASKVNAKKTILTHMHFKDYSNIEQDMKSMVKEVKEYYKGNVCVAKDLEVFEL
ncbi:MAG: Ribonuclease Z [Candidatus Woesearchaeota archaeon]|nr:Ribonuclease Z [Candidatus Woesearchaeota archaeon]